MTDTFYFGDTLTGQILGDLPLSGVSPEWVLSGSGAITGQLAITDPDVRARGALTLEAGKHSIYVDRDGVLLWAGIIWEIGDYDSATGKLPISAGDYWSFFSRRIPDSDIILTSASEAEILDALLASALSPDAPANLSVVTTQVALGTPDISYSYLASERKTVAALVEARAEMSPGVDFRVDTYWDEDRNPQVRVVFGGPILGRSVDMTGAFFDFPGNVTKYGRRVSAASLAGRLHIAGSSDSETPLTQTFDTPATYDGYPRYDRADSIEAATSAALTAQGGYLYSRRSRAVVSYTLETRADVEPSIFSYKVGDYCRLYIKDDLHPSGFDQELRIGAISFSPVDQKVSITPWSDPDA